ncbi:retron St85 family RNA-directed DNA polymerase [Parasphingorhabdus sp.]|uniref:retron St85 family RNA-directed DNA polymerase n=1 Tax=Parasphingorhabdus sp. TaxID=2709688 RepID=UPI003D2A519E
MDKYIDQLASKTRLRPSDVIRIVLSAERRYKEYYIPKRSGGLRQIAHPARELKSVQNALIKLSPEELLVHAKATAYESGCSIVENSKLHVGKNWIAKFDFADFFNSITCPAWTAFLSELGVDKDYIEISKRVFFWKRGASRITRLSVGAPSSPFASNRFMYSFDEKLDKIFQDMGFQYSRYADDIVVSSHDQMDLAEIRSHLISQIPHYWDGKLNDDKTKLLGPSKRRAVTGLILSNDGRVTVGRKRRRRIEAMVCNYANGNRDLSSEIIQGNLGFLKMVDLEAFERLKKKFGSSDLF